MVVIVQDLDYSKKGLKTYSWIQITNDQYFSWLDRRPDDTKSSIKDMVHCQVSFMISKLLNQLTNQLIMG